MKYTIEINDDAETPEDMAEMLEQISLSIQDGFTSGHVPNWTLNKVECQTCGGTGEVSKMEAVYPGEPHMADVGTQPCPDCQNNEPDDDHE